MIASIVACFNHSLPKLELWARHITYLYYINFVLIHFSQQSLSIIIFFHKKKKIAKVFRQRENHHNIKWLKKFFSTYSFTLRQVWFCRSFTFTCHIIFMHVIVRVACNFERWSHKVCKHHGNLQWSQMKISQSNLNERIFKIIIRIIFMILYGALNNLKMKFSANTNPKIKSSSQTKNDNIPIFWLWLLSLEAGIMSVA